MLTLNWEERAENTPKKQATREGVSGTRAQQRKFTQKAYPKGPQRKREHQKGEKTH